MTARRARPAAAPVNLAAKAIKATLSIDAARVHSIVVPEGSGPVPFVITVAGTQVRGQFNPKTLRRAVATVRLEGADNVGVMIQGQLVGDRLEGAGIVAQARRRPGQSEQP
jgi:hypothetical protein